MVQPPTPAITQLQQISLFHQIRTQHSISSARSAACVVRPHNFALRIETPDTDNAANQPSILRTGPGLRDIQA